mmetsp:Transcript_14349/g.23229  ORF Transcript_14349/g.23229 Transcript_14349/m.23229 type:complete len:543 (+) Transcript_14349:110-1738(+)
MISVREPMKKKPPVMAETMGMSSSDICDNDGGHLVINKNDTPSQRRVCCGWLSFQSVSEAKGYNLSGLANGGVIMSNIFLASSLIHLACDEAGGLDPESGTCDSQVSVRGMKPSSLITNIAVISGLLGAFFMPVFGAIVDFTPHRKLTGIVSVIVLTLIQAVQIGTTQKTWFPMAILQAVAGFIFQIQIVAIYSYLPEMARHVGQDHMNSFAAIFTMTQFSSEAIFIVVVTAFGIGLNLDTVQTAMVSQSVSVLWCLLFFTTSWWYFPKRPARHSLEGSKQKSILMAGFYQNYKTAKLIWTKYRKGLKWYLLALMFADSSASAMVTVSVTYLSDTVGLTSTEIGIFFLVALIGTIPGSKMGSMVTAKTNPNTSWKMSQLFLTIVTIIGAVTMEDINGPKELSFIWGLVVGILLGWFYHTESLFFSMCLPKGQEAELAGFFVYCTQILSWLPPLLFTILVENDISQKYGVIATSFGFLVGAVLLSCTGSWTEIVEEADRNLSVVLAVLAIEEVEHNEGPVDKDMETGSVTKSDDNSVPEPEGV